MTHKRLAFIFLLLVMSAILVPVVGAQTDFELPPVNFQDLLAKLGPRSGIDLLFDILLYAIFFIGLVTMILVPDKQLLATLIVVAVIAMALITKVGVDTLFHRCSFVPLVLNAGMFTLPLIVAGMVRQRGGTPKAMAPAALTGLLGGAYFFLFWAVVQSKQCG